MWSAGIGIQWQSTLPLVGIIIYPHPPTKVGYKRSVFFFNVGCTYAYLAKDKKSYPVPATTNPTAAFSAMREVLTQVWNSRDQASLKVFLWTAQKHEYGREVNNKYNNNTDGILARPLSGWGGGWMWHRVVFKMLGASGQSPNCPSSEPLSRWHQYFINFSSFYPRHEKGGVVGLESSSSSQSQWLGVVVGWLQISELKNG